MSQTVYVLKQEQGKSYVGISGDFNSRLDQHQFGEGAEWTKKYPVTGVESTETEGFRHMLHRNNLNQSF